MYCHPSKSPNGSWNIKFSGSFDKAEYYDELINWAKGHDVEIIESPKVLQDVQTHLSAANIVNPAGRKKEDPEKKKRIFDVWKKWYSVLHEKFPSIPEPLKLPGEEARHIKMLLDEYDEQFVLEIFKIAVYDWDALRTLHNKLSESPTLRNVIYLRSELAAGVSNKGITSPKQRVSEYGQSKGGAWDDWKMPE